MINRQDIETVRICLDLLSDPLCDVEDPINDDDMSPLWRLISMVFTFKNPDDYFTIKKFSLIKNSKIETVVNSLGYILDNDRADYCYKIFFEILLQVYLKNKKEDLLSTNRTILNKLNFHKSWAECFMDDLEKRKCIIELINSFNPPLEQYFEFANKDQQKFFLNKLLVKLEATPSEEIE